MKKIILCTIFLTLFCFASQKLTAKTQENIALEIEGNKFVVEKLVANGSKYIFEKINAIVKRDKITPKIGKIPILMYHMLSNNPNLWNSIIVSPEKFEKDMLAIKNAGYR